MLRRSDLLYLQSHREYPSVSILMPTHRALPDSRQDPIRLKNLVREAADRLRTELPARATEQIRLRLEQIASAVDHRRNLDGLALFVSNSISRRYSLPFRPRERVVIDSTFATRDMVFALNRSVRYQVLSLSETPTSLYEGVRDNLEDVETDGFPAFYEGAGRTLPIPDGYGSHPSAVRSEHWRRFLRRVDAALRRYTGSDVPPLVLAGAERHRALFREVSSQGERVLTEVNGSYDRIATSELARLVWPRVREALDERRRQVLTDLDDAVGQRRTASTIDDIWRLAQDGRIGTLLVEEHFYFPARLDDDGHRLLPAPARGEPGVIDDAVDEIIESVLLRGGRTVFVEDDALVGHGRVAAILRY